MIESLRRDVHPAELTLPSGQLERACRVFVTSSRIDAYRFVDGQIVQVFTAPLTGEPPSAVRGSLSRRSGPLVLDTPDGEVLVNRGHGCGCHSPLKALSQPAPWG